MSGLDVSLVPRSIACSLHYLPTFAFSTIYQRMRTRVHVKYTRAHTRTLAELDAGLKRFTLICLPKASVTSRTSATDPIERAPRVHVRLN
jgi:hypothetical protein